jgi:hypothetical protein
MLKTNKTWTSCIHIVTNIIDTIHIEGSSKVALHCQMIVLHANERHCEEARRLPNVTRLLVDICTCISKFAHGLLHLYMDHYR